ncbi:hypothetical protein NP233_g1552 [Leucocoprinus birnbaumii]|uniref:Uncharacterized protein n=1 Tax=Leucocoprinus birnbaumii TaxID=56174 RepID=A0AAD5W3W8_9AGAR|nr:hypothetical protein NP233_g1552 [Leucocoprinus birnbaumii]
MKAFTPFVLISLTFAISGSLARPITQQGSIKRWADSSIATVKKRFADPGADLSNWHGILEAKVPGSREG